MELKRHLNTCKSEYVICDNLNKNEEKFHCIFFLYLTNKYSSSKLERMQEILSSLELKTLKVRPEVTTVFVLFNEEKENMSDTIIILYHSCWNVQMTLKNQGLEKKTRLTKMGVTAVFNAISGFWMD